MNRDTELQTVTGAIHDGRLGEVPVENPETSSAGSRLRSPAWLWFSASATVAAVLSAVLPTAFVALLSGGVAAGRGADPIATTLSSGLAQVFLVFFVAALAAAFLVGAPWALLTARNARRSFLGSVLSGGGVALVFALLCGLGAGLWGLSGGAGHAALLALGAAGAAAGFGVPAGLLAGMIFSPLAFERR